MAKVTSSAFIAEKLVESTVTFSNSSLILADSSGAALLPWHLLQHLHGGGGQQWCDEQWCDERWVGEDW